MSDNSRGVSSEPSAFTSHPRHAKRCRTHTERHCHVNAWDPDHPTQKDRKLGQTSHLGCFFLLLCFGLWLCFGLPLWAFQRHPSNEASLAVVVAWWHGVVPNYIGLNFQVNFVNSCICMVFPSFSFMISPGGAVVVVLIPPESHPLVLNRQAKTTNQ